MTHYKTYIKMFKVKFEISSLGAGNTRIRLPQGVSITFDMFIVGLFSLPVTRYIIAPIIGMFQGASSPLLWFYAVLLSLFLGWVSRKFEPAGRSVVLYVMDILSFLFRSKYSDGWQRKRVRLIKSKVEPCRVSIYDQRKCGVFPAEGNADEFQLRVPSSVKVSKKGKVRIKIGREMNIGHYRVQDRQLVEAE